MLDDSWSLGRALKRLLGMGLAILIAIPFLGILAMMLLLPPAAVIWESVDILRMDATTPGQVTNVTFETGSKGTSRARIEYAFTALGQPFVSDRYLPGFLGNTGSWTGGAAIGNDFPPGRAVTVHYRRADPTSCALEYGWFKWSVAPTAVWLGLAIVVLACLRLRPGMSATALWCIGIASIAYGVCELFVGPSAVRVADLHWHALGWCGALAGAALYAWAKRRFPGPAGDSEHCWIRQNYPEQAASQGESNDALDREHSTPYLVFELLWVVGILTLVVLSSYQGVLTFGEAAIRGLVAGFADASQLFATVAVFIMIGVTIVIYAGLSRAVVSCSRKVICRIAWHRRRVESAAADEGR